MTDNELISEFMGIQPIPEGRRKYLLHNGGLMYDHSWDLLMPVVEKIFMLRNTEMNMSIGSLEIKSLPYKNGGIYFNVSVCEPTLTGIECYHKAVVEFIKWYNINK
jgi:hypothetical protein